MAPTNLALWTLITAVFLMGRPAWADQQFQLEVQGRELLTADPETLVFDRENLYTARPKSEGVLSIFPGYKYENDVVQFVGRGYLTGTADKSYQYDTDPPSGHLDQRATMDFEEIFAGLTFGDLKLFAGLQTFEWGPAEFSSPSQYLVVLHPDNRSSFYREKGLWSARASYTAERINVTALGEFADNREPKRLFSEKFESGGLLKTEATLDRRKNRSVGFVLGRQNENWVGLYGTWELAGGFSAYFDGRAVQTSQVYQPIVQDDGSVDFSPREQQNSDFSITGLRYEGDVDVRLEYINNSVGWSDRQFQALSGQPALWQALNLPAILRPGMEIPGQNYYYASIRKRDWNRWNLYCSDLGSADDQSQLFFTSIEKEVGDSVTLVFEGSVPWGKKDGLANFIWPGSIELGFKAQF